MKPKDEPKEITKERALSAYGEFVGLLHQLKTAPEIGGVEVRPTCTVPPGYKLNPHVFRIDLILYFRDWKDRFKQERLREIFKPYLDKVSDGAVDIAQLWQNPYVQLFDLYIYNTDEDNEVKVQTFVDIGYKGVGNHPTNGMTVLGWGKQITPEEGEWERYLEELD